MLGWLVVGEDGSVQARKGGAVGEEGGRLGGRVVVCVYVSVLLLSLWWSRRCRGLRVCTRILTILIFRLRAAR